MTQDFDLTQWYDLATGTLTGGPRVERHLTDLRGCFANDAALEELIRNDGDALAYAVTAMDACHGPGDLHYGLGVLYPGRVGDEYFLTKGHLHTWRAAAEVYIGIAGSGAMLLEHESTGESRLETLAKGSIVYVPGDTAHRTVNTGSEPLVYIGVYPAAAGHDYGAIAERNFRMCVVDRGGVPTLIPRLS